MLRVNEIFIKETKWGFDIFNLNSPQTEAVDQMAWRLYDQKVVFFINDTSFLVPVITYYGATTANIHSYINSIPPRNASFLVPSPIPSNLERLSKASPLCVSAFGFGHHHWLVSFNKEAMGDDLPLLMLEYSGYGYEEYPI